MEYVIPILATIGIVSGIGTIVLYIIGFVWTFVSAFMSD